jgi:hypothetical protein
VNASAGDKAKLMLLRRRAAAKGYAIRKSRAHIINSDNLGGYMVIHADTNRLIAGACFGLQMDELEKEIAELPNLVRQ